MRKYFINNEAKLKECGNCHKILPFSDYYFEKPETPRTNCKPCTIERIYQRKMEKNLEKYPGAFQQCDNDECAVVFRKIVRFVRRNDCPKCGVVFRD